MKTKIITIIGLLYITIQQPLIAQNMGKQIAKMLSKKEVKELIASGEAIYDSVKSHNEFSNVYRLSEGQLLYVRENGTGALWESQEQINSLMNEAKAEISVFNLEGWLHKDSDIEAMTAEANKFLSGALDKEIDYSEKSLKAVGKIKIKNIVAQKDTFYAILLYACGYYAHHYGAG